MRALVLCVLVLCLAFFGSFGGTGAGSGGTAAGKSKNTTNTTIPNNTVINSSNNSLIPNWNYSQLPLPNATNSTFQTNPTVVPAQYDPKGTINAPFPSNVLSLQSYPNFPGTILLFKPTNTSMTFSVSPNVYVDYYQVVVALTDLTLKYSDRMTQLVANESTEVTVCGLLPNTKYNYYLKYSVAGVLLSSPPHTFQTARTIGTNFAFSVIADSHLFTPQHNYPPRYVQTLLNLKSDSPDFVITLGDDFRTSNVPQPPTFDNIKYLFNGHRPYHNLIGQDIPIYNVNGNHEMEEGELLDGSPNSIPVLVAANRLEFYANPRPDGFYSANSKPEPWVPDGGLLENYYAWTWGDALLIVLDDYWYSPIDSPDWNCTLGYDQFMWLKNVLATSTAKYKFIFHHHVSCVCRGGAEWYNFYEWGGYARSSKNNPRLKWQFDLYRPGWGNQSIHQMMVQYGVNAMFQGHDHLYCVQEVDGIKYVTVPMPAFDYNIFAGGDNDNSASFTEKIYVDPVWGKGGPFGPSGHLTVNVSSTSANVSYYRVGIDGDSWQNNFLNHSFLIFPKN